MHSNSSVLIQKQASWQIYSYKIFTHPYFHPDINTCLLKIFFVINNSDRIDVTYNSYWEFKFFIILVCATQTSLL